MAAANPEAPFFAAYTGPSMHPTLRDPQLLEIRPCGTRPPRAGDIVLVLPPGTEQPIVHRVVRVTLAGVATRGDNNRREDGCLLQPADIRGRVVAAWDGRGRRTVAGGLRGRLARRCVLLRSVLDRGLSPLLRPAYRALFRRGRIARLLPVGLLPRAVVFRAHDGDRVRLMWGRRVIGRYDAQQGEWRIQRPFRIFVSLARLPAGAPRSTRGA